MQSGARSDRRPLNYVTKPGLSAFRPNATAVYIIPTVKSGPRGLKIYTLRHGSAEGDLSSYNGQPKCLLLILANQSFSRRIS